MKKLLHIVVHESVPTATRQDRTADTAKRSGAIVLLAAFLIIMVMGFAAFTIDVGFIANARGQLQAAVDAATLAAAMELNPHIDQTIVQANVRAAASELASINPVGPWPGLLLDPTVDVELGRRDWDNTNKAWHIAFGPGAVPYNLVRVTGRLDQVWNASSGEFVDRGLPTFFAPVLGVDRVNMSTTTTGTYQPRDMMLVLDYSGSMNDDTEFKSIPQLGQTVVTNAITKMWQELDSPVYGSMPFSPQFMVAHGIAANTTLQIPHVDVTYRGTKAHILSTSPINNVTLRFSNGSTQTFSGGAATSGLFQGTGTNSGRQIRRVWVSSGLNQGLSSEGLGERFNFEDNDIKNWLGLGNVNYPHPSGSWTDFIDYVNNQSSVNTAGYRYQYSTMCLINYWNEAHPGFSQTPVLWKVTTQPLSAAKKASDVMIDYVASVEADDRLGLSIYTHDSSAGAILEHGLTYDLAAIKPYYRNRQAGHYDSMTNIGAGIKVAREELEAQARPQAFRMIVLMTDGVANRPSNNPEGYAIQQANLCKDAQIRVMTVSLGLGADTALMQQIADITGGIHFNVPGGGTIEEYESQLMDVFQQIAADRPLKLLPGFVEATQ